ncbi:zf-HC2 domain-containing protein [Micromonospora sp. NPDC049559]|uniref:anti-sigma factor family protein n=1 Tax=Micromonospora sp. NPDC049559 TaxID=3155923 RepID=UPI003439EABC
MTAPTHDSRLLGAYALELLDPPERDDVEAHLADCPECRADLAELSAVKAALGEVPAEALLHGPPDADEVLARTLRQMRVEAATGDRRRRAFVLAAAVAVLAGTLGAGAVIGARSVPRPAPGSDAEAGPPTAPPTAPPVAPTARTPAPGTRVGSVVDPVTGARLTVSMTPAAGWVRVNASVTGIPAGENCRLVVVGRDGVHEIAAGWIVADRGEGTNLDGSAAVAPADVTAVQVRATDGRTYVTLPL